MEERNNEPRGNVVISGHPVVGRTLTVTNDITDEDGIGRITYQWYRKKDSGKRSKIPDATRNTYVLVDDDEGFSISVTASYTDGQRNPEYVVSNPMVLNITADVKKKKQIIIRHSARAKLTQGERVRSGRRSVFFRQPAMWRINHPAGRSNTIE